MEKYTPARSMQSEWYYFAMGICETESHGGSPDPLEDFNRSLLKSAFQEVFASDTFDESAIARYFSPLYSQKTDGHELDFHGFVSHIRELKRTLKNIRITFERMVAEGSNVSSIHRAEAEKIGGGKITVLVSALFVIDEGKIVLCDELTHLEQGAASDHDIASRT